MSGLDVFSDSSLAHPTLGGMSVFGLDVEYQNGGEKKTRDELKEQIDELMRQYAAEEIDGATYAQRMMDLTTSAQNQLDEK